MGTCLSLCSLYIYIEVSLPKAPGSNSFVDYIILIILLHGGGIYNVSIVSNTKEHSRSKIILSRTSFCNTSIAWSACVYSSD